ncbi:MAG: hypothetical protein ACOY3N_04915 [Bradyrhizobium sp.]|uniref:hypothetical protein n=1 Tax=Bradyrhizobium sp. TaxID=376 RepID=UPI0012E3E3F1
MTRIFQERLKILEVQKQLLCLSPFWRSESETIAQGRDVLHALASGCGPMFEELELLQILSQPVLFGDEQLGDCASAVRHEVGVVQQRDVVVDIRSNDVPMHGALPPAFAGKYYHYMGGLRRWSLSR